MPTSLVTGAAGFLGSHVAHHLEQIGHRVVGVDNLSGGHPDNLRRCPVTLCTDDVCDQPAMQRIFDRFQPDYVFHLAAYAAEGLSHYIRRYNYTNNVIGSMVLINEAIARGVQRFVFTSSMAVYGTNQLPMTEDLTPQPEDPYGIAKYAVELDLRAAHELFGLDYTIFRPHNVYGEKQNIGDRYRNVIAIFMNQLMQGERMTVYGDGRQTRAFSYINDVAPIIAHSIEVPGSANQTFNIGADRPYTLLELAHAVAEAFEVEPSVMHLPPRFEVKHAYTSHDKLRAVFGDRKTVDLHLGLARMADWAKRHGPQSASQFTGIELPDNLPSFWSDTG